MDPAHILSGLLGSSPFALILWLWLQSVRKENEELKTKFNELVERQMDDYRELANLKESSDA